MQAGLNSLVFAGTLALAVVAPVCATTVGVAESCSDLGKVSWSSIALPDGTCRVDLSADPADGAVFVGWTVSDAGFAWNEDSRLPEVTGLRLSTNAVVRGYFLEAEEDSLSFDLTGVGEVLDVNVPVEIELEVDSQSYPKMTFSGLPPGLDYDPRRLMLYGRPHVPGIYRVVANATNAAGFTFSQTLGMVVSNPVGDRTEGLDTEILLNEYWYAEPYELLVMGEGAVVVSVKNLPAGLVWDPAVNLFYGTPTKTGTQATQFLVSYPDGLQEEVGLFLTVKTELPERHGVDLFALSDLMVGDNLDDGDCLLGTYSSSGGGIVSVEGLPEGLSSRSWLESGVRLWSVVGQVSRAGVYTVKVKVRVPGEVADIQIEEEIWVRDAADVYVRTGLYPSTQADAGFVRGGGAKTVCDPVILQAVPSAGYVFAGWYDEDGEPLQDLAVDFRSAEIGLPSGTDFALLKILARFEAESADDEVAFDALDGVEFLLDSEESFREEFGVVSLSLPLLEMKGLPKGVGVRAETSGRYLLHYEPEAVETAPQPGFYRVQGLARNATGASASAAFVIVVGNSTDERVSLEDDYGEFDLELPIEPIDLSEAVDFSAGETLSVSGLPKGLSYSSKETAAGPAYQISGTPMESGDFTLRFRAKVLKPRGGGEQRVYEVVNVTAFLHVRDYPSLTVDIDEEAKTAGNRVEGLGRFKSGSRVTLEAKAAPGWVFAGWDLFGLVDGLASKSPVMTFGMPDGDADFGAWFIPVEDDSLYIDEPMTDADGYAAVLDLGVDIRDSLDEFFLEDLIWTESFPAVRISGLPLGVRFRKSGVRLEGTPKRAGVYFVTMTARNAGGYRFTRTFSIAVRDELGQIPAREVRSDDLGLDFAPLQKLVTGVTLSPEVSMIKVPRHPLSGAAIRRVSLMGVPQGLYASVKYDENGGAQIVFSGIAREAGRSRLTVGLTYCDGNRLKSACDLVIADGGSAYLSVGASGPGSGRVFGTGVYSSGQRIRLAAYADSGSFFVDWDFGGNKVDNNDIDEENRSVRREIFGPWLSDKSLEIKALFGLYEAFEN